MNCGYRSSLLALTWLLNLSLRLDFSVAGNAIAIIRKMRSKGSSLTLDSCSCSFTFCNSTSVALHILLSRNNFHRQFMVRAKQAKNVCTGTRSLFCCFLCHPKTSSTTRAHWQEASRSSFCAIDCKETHFVMFLPLFNACYPRRTASERSEEITSATACSYMHFRVPVFFFPRKCHNIDYILCISIAKLRILLLTLNKSAQESR